MTAAASAPARYANDFLREVEERVEGGEWVKMCMQCGVCAGSCPLGPHWEHTPQKIFMMIRAGKREAVLTSDALWMCVSCYNCIVRCPRKLPITHIIHGLATYAHRQGLAPKVQGTRDFSLHFWANIARAGRLNEMKLTMGLYFKDGLVAGIRNAWNMRKVASGLMRTKRLNPLEIVKGHECKDKAGIGRMLRKAYELEDARRGKPL